MCLLLKSTDRSRHGTESNFCDLGLKSSDFIFLVGKKQVGFLYHYIEKQLMLSNV